MSYIISNDIIEILNWDNTVLDLNEREFIAKNKLINSIGFNKELYRKLYINVRTR